MASNKPRKSSIPRTTVSVSAHNRAVIEHRVPSKDDIDKLMWQVYEHLENSGESFASFSRRSGINYNTVLRLVAEEVPTMGPQTKTLRRLLHAGIDVSWYTDKYYPNLFDDLRHSDIVGQLLELGIALAGFESDPQEQRWSQQKTMLILGIGAKLARLEGADLEEAVNFMHTMMLEVPTDQPVRMEQALDLKSMQAVIEATSGEFRLINQKTKTRSRKRVSKNTK